MILYVVLVIFSSHSLLLLPVRGASSNVKKSIGNHFSKKLEKYRIPRFLWQWLRCGVLWLCHIMASNLFTKFIKSLSAERLFAIKNGMYFCVIIIYDDVRHNKYGMAKVHNIF
jgi:hypothetical protein